MRNERELQTKSQLEAERELDARYKSVGISSVAAAAKYCAKTGNRQS